MPHVYQTFVHSLSHGWKAGLLLGLLSGASIAHAQSPHPYVGLKAMLAPGITKTVTPAIQQPTPITNKSSQSGGFSTNALADGQNDDVQLFPSNNSQTEVHISIDKSNPNNLIASSNIFLSSGGFSVGYYYSRDAGLTWSGSDNPPNGGQTSGDPSTAYDIGGRAYLVSMSPNSDRYLVQASGDKGVTWTNQVGGSSFESSGMEFDKEMITTDDIPVSPYVYTLYSAWTVFNTSNGETTIKINHSTDQSQTTRGQNFSTPIVLVNPTAGHDTGTNVQTGPNGEVYVCWADYPGRGGAATGIGFTRSTNGGASFTSPTTAFTKTGIEVNGNLPDPLFNNTRVNDFPAMAVDKSNGSHRGRVYIVYAAKENGVNTGKAIIQIRFSDNQGTSWSAPVTASIPSGRQNWFPWIAVDDTNGDVSIVYYSQDAPSGFATNTYVAYSADGGNSFCNLKVSDASHIPVTSAGSNVANGYAGDYIGITAYGGKAYPTWADNRTGTSTWQLYTSPVAYASITGANQLCINSTLTYGIANAATGASVQWSSSNTSIATINASTGAATGVAQGTVVFTAVIGTSCGTTITRTKTVQVGNSPITGTYFCSGCTGQTYAYAIDPNQNYVKTGQITFYINSDGAATYTFSTYPAQVTTTSANGGYFYINSAGPSTQRVSLTVNKTTSCGNSSQTFTFVAQPNSPYIVASPNPASSTMTVAATDPTAPDPSAPNPTASPFDAELYDTYGKKVKVKHSAEGKANLDVSDLPDGLYNLRVGTGKDAYSKHVQVTH